MLLELDHISKIYGDLHAVDDLNLTVPEGEWLAIVGSSGSGKTTLMNMIGCMDTPSKGSVKLEGRKLEDLNATQLADVRKNLIGLVFQKFYLVPHLTAVENVMVAQYYHSVVDEKQAMEALEKVGLKDRAHHLPGQLSGGEQQRVAIADRQPRREERENRARPVPQAARAGHHDYRGHPRCAGRQLRAARDHAQPWRARR